LIIGGGIAAFKSLELIRRLKERHVNVRCVLTKAAQQFVTPLSASALSHERVYTDLFDPESEFDAGHIRLARECDLIVVAPATADLMAKMAQGHADDLASAILLAANRPILLALAKWPSPTKPASGGWRRRSKSPPPRSTSCVRHDRVRWRASAC
jgi:phosphopantothenoylcysteine decarboxylase/phosphopantothenate--cysteine ligase